MKKSSKSMIIKTSVIVLTVLVTLSYMILQKPKVTYAPFATSAEDLDLHVIDTSEIMEGTSEGDLIVASQDGSKIFAKGGLNYVVLADGNDEVYYSLCSTKIVDNKVNVIEGFDIRNDKLKVFCAHHKIIPEEIKIIHDRFEGEEVTYVQVQGKHSLTAIALLGYIPLQVSDIILNERWHFHQHQDHKHDHNHKEK